MEFSLFGEKFGAEAGITSLMDDLGEALTGQSDMIMMGGGNPAHIPEVQEAFKVRINKIVADKNDFSTLIGIYDPPQGNKRFIQALCTLLNSLYSWNLKPENIALTNGSQSAFFMLFNLFAGEFKHQKNKQIHLPLTPEYIGYADSGLTHDFFKAHRPIIEEQDEGVFKYKIDFDRLALPETCGALCVSRPTNPSGNVLTDQEIFQLDALAKQHKVPLIIDGAYGTPFPSLIFSEAEPFWNENIVMCLSLSKFGLPAARTGIVIANPEIVKALSSMNAIMNLATGSFGSLMALDLLESKEIIQLSKNIINPYYRDRAFTASSFLQDGLKGLPVKMHKVEGAMFIWLWLKDCPIANDILYQRLKAKGVLIVSGHHFFPGLSEIEKRNWRHTQECIRITYSQDDAQVRRGLNIIIEEIKQAYRKT